MRNVVLFWFFVIIIIIIILIHACTQEQFKPRLFQYNLMKAYYKNKS